MQYGVCYMYEYTFCNNIFTFTLCLNVYSQSIFHIYEHYWVVVHRSISGESVEELTLLYLYQGFLNGHNNVAKGKPSWQSSLEGSSIAKNGNNCKFASKAKTLAEDWAYWAVDLQSSITVDSIVLYSRSPGATGKCHN